MKSFILKPWQRIVLHVILPAGLTVALFAGATFFYTARFEGLLYDESKRSLDDMMDIVFSIVENYESKVQSGQLSREDAQKQVKDRLRAVQYGPKGDYFWINDLNNQLIMHPYLPNLEGKDISDLQDITGKRFIKDFSEVAAKHGSGYIEYMWQWHGDPNRIMPKLGYVRLFKPWGWVIGTSIYVEEVQGQIDNLTWDIHRNTIVIFLIVALLCGYLILHGIKTEVERKKVEQELTQSFEHFKTVLDSLDAIVYVSDTETHEVLFVNKCGLQKASGAQGRYCWQVLHIDQVVPCETCRLEPLIKGTRQQNTCIREIHDAQRNRWYECRDQLIQWVDGRLVCLEIASDITDRKGAEQERERLMKELSLKNEELQSIVYAASHDLRSPLINIQGFSKELGNSCGRLIELLRRPERIIVNQDIVQTIINEDIPESLDFIQRNTEKMQTLVNGLLQLSRIGTAKLHFKSLNMNELINDVLTASGYQIKSIGAGIEVGTLPPARGDYNQINQVFSNLLDNSLKYRQKDRELKIKITGKVLNGTVEYAVSDNGIGIPKMHFGRVFELFQQLKPSVSSAEGVGLGLTIVKRIMDIHNGSIRVESEPDHGSTFYVTLPRG